MIPKKASKIKVALYLLMAGLIAADLIILIPFFLDAESTARETYLVHAGTMSAILTSLFLLTLFSRNWIQEITVEEKNTSLNDLVSENTFFRLLSERTNDMIHFNDAEGIIQYVNPVTLELLGYQPDEIINHHAEEFIHPSDRAIVYEDMQRVHEGINLPPRAIRLLKKNGDWLDIEAKGFLFGLRGKRQYIGAILRDISYRKKNEHLVKIKNDWEHTFNTINDLVSVHDKDFNIIKVNDALCQFLGKKSEEILNKKCFEIFHNTDRPIPGCPHEQAMNKGHSVTMEILDDHTAVPLQVTCSPFIGSQGGFKGSVHIARPLAEKKNNRKNEHAGIVPICASCKDIRTDRNTWIKPEEFFHQQYGSRFTHCICLECQKKLYPEFMDANI